MITMHAPFSASGVAARSMQRLHCSSQMDPGKRNSSTPAPRRAALYGSVLLLSSPLWAAPPVKAVNTREALEKEFGKELADRLVKRQGEVRYSEEEWRNRLDDPLSYRVLRQEATERPFTSPLNNEKRTGSFACMGCGQQLFASTAKFDSGTGWPSFYQPLPNMVRELPDYSIPFIPRTEVRCARCEGHLGHVFQDGPPPTGLRYCINGAALTFQPASA